MQIITKCFAATLFAAFTMPVCSFAQEEAGSREAVGIFDFNKFEHPVSSNDSHNGDITIVEIYTSDDVTMAISPKSKGGTENRFWSYSDGPQLRMYSGTITFTATEGTMLQNIYFVASRWNDGNSANVGTLNGDTWTGTAQEVTISFAGNTQINKIYVGVEPETPVVSTIAEFKALTSGSKGILTLADARVTAVAENVAFVEDNSGAIKFYDTKLDLEAGKLLNGTIIAKYRLNYGAPELVDVQKSELTQTDGEVLPTVMTLSEMLKVDNLMRFVQIEDARIEDGEKQHLVDGEAKVQILDLFEANVIKSFRKVKNITGIYGHDINLDGAVFYPTALELYKAENIAALKTMEEGADVEVTLQNAMCTVGYGNRSEVFEDASGAIKIETGTKEHVGNIYNGTIIARFWQENRMPLLTYVVSADIEKTEGKATPTLMSVADMPKEENIWRYVCTGPVEVADREIVEGDNNIAYVNVSLLDNVVSAESIRGIIIRYGETYALEPVSVKNAITTGIETVSTMSQRMSVFSVSGRQYDTPRKGLNIVHTSNGSVQKILVK